MKGLLCLLLAASLGLASAQTPSPSPPACPTLFLTPDGRSGVLSSNPGSPPICYQRYQNNLNCNYNLIEGYANLGNGVNITFDFFDLEQGYDYAYFYYTNGSYGEVSQTFTGTLGRISMVLPATRGTPVRLYFRTDSVVAQNGFFLRFSARQANVYRIGGTVQVENGGIHGSFNILADNKKKK